MMQGFSGMPFTFENADSVQVRTPGPKRATRPSEKAFVNFVSLMRNPDVSPELLAAEILTQPVDVQRNIWRFVAAMLGHWTEFGETVSSGHPLADVYDTSRTMVNRLFTR